jgi:hypothetical protein
MPLSQGRKGGKKNRKHGRGVSKVAKSRFGSYAGLFAHTQKMKEVRMAARERRFARRRAIRAAKAALSFWTKEKGECAKRYAPALRSSKRRCRGVYYYAVSKTTRCMTRPSISTASPTNRLAVRPKMDTVGSPLLGLWE